MNKLPDSNLLNQEFVLKRHKFHDGRAKSDISLAFLSVKRFGMEEKKMRLDEQGLQNRQAWEAAGYELPGFDREQMIAKTKEAPFWVHFGAGNIFKAFLANVVQRLLNDGTLDRGLVAAEGFDYEIIEKMNRPHDDLNILVTLKADGNVEKTVIGSIAE